MGAAFFPLIVALSFIILSGQFQINSIYASFIGLSLCALFIVFKRHDLVKVALLNGVFLVLAAIPVYIIVLQIYPELIQRYWFVHNLSGISIFGVPIEELAWYFFWGITIGPFYEFAKGLGDRRIPKSRYNKK